MRARRLALLVWLAVLLAPAPAPAHKVSLFAAAAGDSVRIEAYFADGSPCTGAAVSVYGQGGEELLSFDTDSRGQGAFQRPGPGGLRLVVYAGMGHRAEFELEPAAGPQEGGDAAATAVSAAPAPAPKRGHAAADSVLVARLEASLERRLRPLETAVRRLERAQERADFKDAVAGVGFILGLAGLWALLVNRGKREP